MRILGLTGDIAAGKSTVARLLESRGAVLLDSDALVHELYSDPAFAAKVAALFQEPVLAGDGSVDRRKLGAVVFQDADGLACLEALVHPAVFALRSRRVAELGARPQPPPAVVLEAVKLLESGGGAGCDEIWCVVSNPEVAMERMINNRHLTRAQALERLAAQPRREAKLELAGSVPLVWIENNSSGAELEAAVGREWKRFLAKP